MHAGREAWGLPPPGALGPELRFSHVGVCVVAFPLQGLPSPPFVSVVAQQDMTPAPGCHRRWPLRRVTVPAWGGQEPLQMATVFHDEQH